VGRAAVRWNAGRAEAGCRGRLSVRATPAASVEFGFHSRSGELVSAESGGQASREWVVPFGGVLDGSIAPFQFEAHAAQTQVPGYRVTATVVSGCGSGCESDGGAIIAGKPADTSPRLL
jgi:hypothetical protein